MKHLLWLFLSVVVAKAAYSQVTIQTNMPPVIDAAGATVQVKITKGAIVNFARYQMDLPAGVSVQEDESKGGTFAFENDHAKVFWADIPADPEITISLKLLAGTFSGPAKITQKFYYMEEGVKKETEGESLDVTFKGTPPAENATNLGGLPNTAGSPSEKLQAEQLKKDSKEAYNTGLKEQSAADKKLAEANAALKKAQAIQNEEEKQAAVKKASEQKQKAESDKAVASKILALARSLDDNANEIDRLNKTAGSSAAPGSPGSAAAAPVVVSDSGTVYRLQLGAFSQNPEKVLYKHLGLINIVNENGMYKVLMGRYATREDAVKKRDELIARSFDCFIVTYKDGVRAK